MKTKTKIRRLKKLVKVVKRSRHGDVELDMRVWARKDYDGDVSACALGLAGLNKKFRAKGFETTIGTAGNDNSLGIVRYRGRTGAAAASEFFGISFNEAEELAHAGCYDHDEVGPKQVVKYVKTLIREVRTAG